jgi:hypothetical protein
MRCFHISIAAALFALSASSIAAQTSSPPDSTRVTTLATVTVTAERGNWFTRAHELRQSVLTLMTENRRLTHELRRQDAHVLQLETRLDSLKQVEAEKQATIVAIADSISATRARRRALEARVIAAEARQPER